MGLFGTKEPPRTSTNAPRHWPAMTLTPEVQANRAIAYLHVAGTLSKGLPQAQLSFMETHLLDDGVLQLPLVVTEGTQRTAVFLYADGEPASAAHYSGLRQTLKALGNTGCVYYGPAALTPAKAAPVAQPLDSPHFTPARDREAAAYALWWPAGEGDALPGSPALAALDRWFAAGNGYASYFFSAFVRQLNLDGQGDKGPPVYWLPAQPLMAHVDGPGGTRLLLHASEAQGFFFAFDVARTTRAQRDLTLRHLATFAEGFRRALEARRIAPEPNPGPPAAFWAITRAAALEKAGGPGLHVHHVAQAGSTRVRMLGASLLPERDEALKTSRTDPATATALDTEIAWALTQIGSHPPGVTAAQAGRDATVNLQPSVVFRTGPRVRRILRPQFDPPQAVQSVPGLMALLDEPPDLVAVTWDGILRNDDGSSRVDAILVQVQSPSAPHSQIFAQPYVAGPPPAVQGRVTILPPQPSILQGATGVRRLDAPPLLDAERQAFLDRCVAAAIQWITVSDPSGADAWRADGPMFSPSTYLSEGGRLKVVKAMGGMPFAVHATRQTLAKEPAPYACLSWDHVEWLDGVPARSLRYRLQAQGETESIVFVQDYAPPLAGTPFAPPPPRAAYASGSIYP